MSNNTHFPDIDDFLRSRKKAGLVPVYRTIISDLDTPLTLFAKIAGQESHLFLFESMEGGEKWGRYSFIGFDPLLTFSSKGSKIDITSFTGGLKEQCLTEGDPLKALQKILDDFRAAENEDLPRFCGGAVGFLGYDIAP